MADDDNRTPAPRLCKDCGFAALEDEDGKMVWRCTHRSSKFTPRPNLVTGAPVYPYQLRCSDARCFPADQMPYCGEEGRYWEPRSGGSGPVPLRSISF